VKPDIDRDKLSCHFAAFLEREGLSYRAVSSRHPDINPAMASRAINGRVLSAASLLAICRAMAADPFDYLILIDPRQRNQGVTAIGKRETEGHRYG